MKVNQNGNVLFLILIAVVLFSALAFAVTRSSRTSGDANSEIAKLGASAAYDLFAQIDSAFTRLQVVNGCSDAEIGVEFKINNATGTGTAAYAAASPWLMTQNDWLGNFGSTGDEFLFGYDRRIDGSCDLFGPTGGNVNFQPTLITAGSNRYFTLFGPKIKLFSVEIAPVPGQVMTDKADLTILFGADTSKPDIYQSLLPICKEINRREGLPTPNDSAGDGGNWTGSPSGEFWGKNTFCANNQTNGSLIIRHVIAER